MTELSYGDSEAQHINIGSEERGNKRLEICRSPEMDGCPVGRVRDDRAALW